MSVTRRVSRSSILQTEIRTAEPQHAVVLLAGELDTSNVGQLYEELAQLTREGVLHITIDVAEFDFVDSTGLSAIIAAHKRAEASGGELIVPLRATTCEGSSRSPVSTTTSTSDHRSPEQLRRDPGASLARTGSPVASTKARSPGEPVCASTSQPMAVRCRKLPLAKTTWPPKFRRKGRDPEPETNFLP